VTTATDELLRSAGEATAYADSRRVHEAHNAWSAAHAQFHNGLEPALRAIDDPHLLEIEYTFSRFHAQLGTRSRRAEAVQNELEVAIQAAIERLKRAAAPSR